MQPIVFIHTNDKQLLGARLAAYALKARSAQPDDFEVRLLRLEETPHLYRREGQRYLRKGRQAIWRNDDLQSFSPLRRMIPQLMGYAGRGLVIDPDIFAVGDVNELLTRDMQGKSLLCRYVNEGYRGNGNRFYASSVMLLDCGKLQHWDWDADIDAMFEMKLDYGPWISLLTEPEEIIGPLEAEWNHLDELTPETKLLHNTERSTQPWKTGLPVDYDTTWRKTAVPPAGGIRGLMRGFRQIIGRAPEAASVERYLPHPDDNQVRFFFALAREALEAGAIDEAFVREQIARKHCRPDLLEMTERLAA